jgi:3-hydroxybutyryl-CoA dehydratase
MQRPTLPKRVPDSMDVGAKVAFTRTFTEADVALFIGVTWDINPLHTDLTYAEATPFKRLIVPGLLTASLLTHFGGLWAFIAQEMVLEYTAPVHVGDSITAESEVVENKPEKGWVRLQCRCTNQDGVEVLRAKVSGYPGTFE